MEKFTFIDISEKSAQHSYDIITKMCEDGTLGAMQPDEIVPLVMDEEKEWADKFPDQCFDLIVSNMTMHWVNDIEGTFKRFHDSLEPDGAFLAASVGGESF